MILELQMRLIYGTPRIYPMNSQAEKVAELLKRKTLTQDDVELLKSIGFRIKWIPFIPS